jgi:hypothetical protein
VHEWLLMLGGVCSAKCYRQRFAASAQGSFCAIRAMLWHVSFSSEDHNLGGAIGGKATSHRLSDSGSVDPDDQS